MLFSICKGNVKKPPIVFLHGFLGSHEDFFPIIDCLKEDFFCFTLDLPGHGKSPLVPSRDPFQAALREISKTLKSLKRFHLVGYSMGGRLALLFAKKFPELVQSLTILSANPGLMAEEKAKREQMDQYWASILEKEGLELFLEKWYSQPMFGNISILSSRKKNDVSSLSYILRNLSIAKQPSLWNDLDSFSMPISFVFGEKDQKYLLVNQRIRENHSHITVSLVKGSFHAVHLEKPLEVAKFIEENKSCK